jgi:hypothetical protein
MTRCLTVSVLGTAMALAGVSCGKSPTTSTSVIGGGPTAPYRIAAHVSAPDFSAVAGARVEVVDGPYAGTFRESDQNGQCTLSAVFNAVPTPEIRTIRDGFIPESVRFPASEIRGDTVTMHFWLTPTAAPAMVAGVYTMTTNASSTCTNLPGDVRTWTNAATISQNSQHPSEWASVGIVPNGNPGCGFYGGVLGDSVGFVTDPDCSFPDPAVIVLAQLGSGGSLQGVGSGNGRISGSTINTSFNGDLMVPGATCKATDHQFTFLRQSEAEVSGVHKRVKR